MSTFVFIKHLDNTNKCNLIVPITAEVHLSFSLQQILQLSSKGTANYENNLLSRDETQLSLFIIRIIIEPMQNSGDNKR